MKICNKCKIEKDLNEFHKDSNKKDGLRYQCKECSKQYNKKRYENNKEKLLKQGKKWKENNPEYYKKWRGNNPEYYKDYYKKRYEDNPEYQKERNKEWHQNNPDYDKKHSNSKANYNTFAQQISYAEKVRNVDEFLQVKCASCRNWYFPTYREVQSRIKALNGKQNSDGTECRLYCSEECKQSCSIFNKRKFQEGHPMKNENLSREVQPELREMVFERDEYTCIRCGKHQDDLDVALHCHHMEGIQQNPIESADIDICVTVCKNCHEEIHQEDGCRYVDMRCKNK